jgi:hypothetical protein
MRDCRALCLKYADIFRDTIAALPAHLTPFEIMVNKAKWEQPGNRGLVRPQSAKKEVEIDKALKEMLLNKIIEPSSAVYYSHPVIVQRTLNSFRFCIDYRRLNECNESLQVLGPKIFMELINISKVRVRSPGILVVRVI